MRKYSVGHFLLPLGLLFCVTPWASSASALVSGVVLAVLFENPYLSRTRKITKALLWAAIVALGAGTDLNVVAAAGVGGLGFTLVALSVTLFVGWLLGRILKTNRVTSDLVNVGTAICGGSAIAALAAAIRSPAEETSVALGIVFILNACGLILFPPLGHYFQMTQVEFGLWSALAIHDTSSVVGATMQYGTEALAVGTTVKLVRALWIIPVTIVFSKLYARKDASLFGVQASYPWFILGFLFMSFVMTWLPKFQVAGHFIESVGKRLLIVTLFLIGSGLTRATLQKVGHRPMVHGVVLWVFVAIVNFFAVKMLAEHLY